MSSQCWGCDARGCNCSAKNQLGDICHDFFSASGRTRRRRLVIVAQKIGIHRRKFHHTFLNIMQSCIAGEARRIAANVAKLPELVRK
jgi:hypothetical protein